MLVVTLWLFFGGMVIVAITVKAMPLFALGFGIGVFYGIAIGSGFGQAELEQLDKEIRE